MPRQARLIIDGGYYHIVTRGIDRRRLFRCAQDYRFFLDMLTQYLSGFQLNILHYCLMPNHVHLLIRVLQKEDLAKFMQLLLQVYASYYRRKSHSTGFIFQNRYKSKYIDNDSYLLDCGRYIERNPLRAKITDDLISYSWSSFSYYARGTSDDIIKSENILYLGLANTTEERRTEYIRRTLENRPYEQIIDKEFRIK